MKNLPKVIITGFPNSGTSFLCNLIVTMGKSPGKQEDLKKGDKHNPWGYYENLKLRDITYRFLPEKQFTPWKKEKSPKTPVSFDENEKHNLKNKITSISIRDNIEVYKDNSLPLLYPLFPERSKYIVIRRNPEKCYKSPEKGGHDSIPAKYEEFLEAYKRYHKLVKKMAQDRKVLIINYEDFSQDFDSVTKKIAEFIDVNINDELLQKCRKIFKPRSSRHKGKTPFYEYLFKYYPFRKIREIYRTFFFKKQIRINKPVFIIGLQGGGLTLISRILRRNPNSVSVGGNMLNWHSVDEMQNELSQKLPEELRLFNSKFYQKEGFFGGGWMYGTDKYFNYFRKTEKGVTKKTQKKFIDLLRRLIARHAFDTKTARIIDKSQSYGLKIPFLNKILNPYNPKFVVMTRNPYIICYKSIYKPALSLQPIDKLEKLNLAAQHYRNCMQTMITDLENHSNGIVIKFEEFLENPEDTIKKICDFASITFYQWMLPKPEDKRGGRKWYPIQQNINQEWLEKISNKEIEIINSVCGQI